MGYFAIIIDFVLKIVKKEKQVPGQHHMSQWGVRLNIRNHWLHFMFFDQEPKLALYDYENPDELIRSSWIIIILTSLLFF